MKRVWAVAREIKTGEKLNVVSMNFDSFEEAFACSKNWASGNPGRRYFVIETRVYLNREYVPSEALTVEQTEL